MKDVTGLIRKVDKLGRVVIPKEMREQLGIKDNSDVSFMIRNDYITIKPIGNTEQCFNCGSTVRIDDNFCSKCGVILDDRCK